MGVIVQRVPGRHTGFVERVVSMYDKFVQGFMNFADVGFRYIDIPKDDELNKPKKKR